MSDWWGVEAGMEESQDGKWTSCCCELALSTQKEEQAGSGSGVQRDWAWRRG